jgi:NADP-dependent 3-hydroxy acid dehydrogenase YdfG
MVRLSDIRKSNADYAAQGHHSLVCVFAGATAGIGTATLRELVGLVHSSTFYILGRDPHRYQHKLDELKQINPTNTIIFVDAQISLISSVDKACALIRSSADRVDMICVSPGGMPFRGAVCAYPTPTPLHPPPTRIHS